MNKVTILKKIAEHIQYFKNATGYLFFNDSSSLPASYSTVASNSSTITVVNQLIGHLTNKLKYTEVYSFPSLKAKSVISHSAQYNIRIYPNRRVENIKHSTSVSITDIPLLAVDSDGNTIEALVKGGGLKDSVSITNAHNSLTDIGRFGYPSAASASVIIELPSSIKETFSEQEIISLIKKYSSGGVQLNILYY